MTVIPEVVQSRLNLAAASTADLTFFRYASLLRQQIASASAAERVSMKAVILAAGYGTRLQRDVAADRSGRFAHLVGLAKPLLPVGNRALLSHWIRALAASRGLDGIYVVVSPVYNRRPVFYSMKWTLLPSQKEFFFCSRSFGHPPIVRNQSLNAKGHFLLNLVDRDAPRTFQRER